MKTIHTHQILYKTFNSALLSATKSSKITRLTVLEELQEEEPAARLILICITCGALIILIVGTLGIQKCCMY